MKTQQPASYFENIIQLFCFNYEVHISRQGELFSQIKPVDI